MSAIAKLLELSSPSISAVPFCLERVPEHFCSAAKKLLPILGSKNGFYAFASALHAYGTDTVEEVDLLAWNADNGWRKEFGAIADRYFFFAEDAFGGQFCTDSQCFYHFDIETGDTRSMGTDAESWSATLLSDFGYWTGHGAALKWQQHNEELKPGMRLFPRRPFVLGGDYEPENLWAGNARDALGFFGFVARHINALPDGTDVELMMPTGVTLAGTIQR